MHETACASCIGEVAVDPAYTVAFLQLFSKEVTQLFDYKWVFIEASYRSGLGAHFYVVQAI